MDDTKLIVIQTEMDIIFKLLSLININITNLNELENIEIERDVLLNPDLKSHFDLVINDLKKNLSSSKLNCLHDNKHSKQKWPQLNLLRQVLKSKGYIMIPNVKCMGYTNNGKKITKRYFTFKLNT